MTNPWFDFLQESLGKVGATMGRTPEAQGLGAAYGMTGLEYTILPYLIATGGDVKKAADLAKGRWVENVQLKQDYGSPLAGAMTYPAGSGIAGVTAKAPVGAMARVAATKVGKGLETAGETIAPKVAQLVKEEVGAIGKVPTPAQKAALTRSLKRVEALQSGAPEPKQPKIPAEKQLQSSLQRVEQLQAKGQPPEITPTSGAGVLPSASAPIQDTLSNMGTALHDFRNNREAAQRFIQDNVTPYIRNRYGDAPLMYADVPYTGIARDVYLDVATGGWEPRLKEMGFTPVPNRAGLWKMPEAPKLALTGGQGAPPIKPPTATGAPMATPPGQLGMEAPPAVGAGAGVGQGAPPQGAVRVFKGWVPYDYTAEGEPLITKIQRPSAFPTFQSGEPDLPGIAGFFSTDRKVAEHFAKGISKHGVVGTFDIQLGRTYEINAKGLKAGDVEFGKTGGEFRQAVRSGDYDTIVIRGTSDEGDVYVALRPENIAITDSGISSHPELAGKYSVSQGATAKTPPLTPSVRTPGPSAALQKFFGEIDAEIKRARLKAGALKSGFWRGKVSAADVTAAEAKVAELQQLRKDTILMELPDDVAAKYEEAWRIRESIPSGLGPVETSRINQSDPAYQFRGILDLFKKSRAEDVANPAFRQMVKNRYGQGLDEIAAHVSPGGYTESMGEEWLIAKLRSFSGKPTGASKAYDAQLKQANAFIKEVESGRLSSGPTIPLEEDIRRRTEAAYERYRKGAEEDFRKAIEDARKKFPEQGGPLPPETAGATTPPPEPYVSKVQDVPRLKVWRSILIKDDPIHPLGEGPRGPNPSVPIPVRTGLSEELPPAPVWGDQPELLRSPVGAGETVPPGPPGGRQPYLGTGAPPEFPPVPQRRALATIPGEKIGTAVLREFSGAKETAGLEVGRWAQKGQRALKGVGFRNVRNGVVQVGGPEMKDLTLALHGEAPPPVDPRMRAIFDDVKGMYRQEEQAMAAFDPTFAGVIEANPDYAHRLWLPPANQAGIARGSLGAKQAFQKMRNDATFQEMLDAGFTPVTWNPYEMAKLRVLEGVQYRENLTLLEQLKANGLAVPASQAPEGWRVPTVGPAFEGKGYKNAAGQWQTTEATAMPKALASRLEAMMGKKAGFEVGGVELLQPVLKASEMFKRLKLTGSGFQHIDFAQRGAGALIAGGHPLKVVPFLGRLANVSFREAPRQALLDKILSGKPLYPGSDISLKMVAQKGWELTGDPSIMSRSVFDQAKQALASPPPGTTRAALQNAAERVKDVAKFAESGLFEGVYRESQATALENVIIPYLRQAHPAWSSQQIAGAAATEVNKMFSSLANWQSVAGSSPAAQAAARLFIFSSNEAESAIRQAIGSFAGQNKGLWRKYWVGLTLFMAGVANAINMWATGKPLSPDQYSPFNLGDQYSPMPGGLSYNTRFLSPQLPWKGQDGRDLYLDVVGQADTAYRLIADPAGFATARLSVPVRAAQNQQQGEDFMGKPIITLQDRITQAAGDIGMPISGAYLAEAAKGATENKLGWLPASGEARVGPTGNLIQATGVNVRSSSNQEMLDRAAQVYGKKWDDLTPSQQATLTSKDASIPAIAAREKEKFTGIIDVSAGMRAGKELVGKLPEQARTVIDQSGIRLQLDRRVTLKGGQKYFLNDEKWKAYQELVLSNLTRRLASVKPLSATASATVKASREKTVKDAFTGAKNDAERVATMTGTSAGGVNRTSVPSSYGTGRFNPLGGSQGNTGRFNPLSPSLGR